MVLAGQKLADLMPDVTQLESDEPEMESSVHYLQLLLLVTCLEWWWRDREDFFIGANLTIFYNRQQLKAKDFRGPDFFLVKDTTKTPRRSWAIWEEDGKYPDLIIELLSDSTAAVDRDFKRRLYQNRFKTPEYFWFSPEDLEFVGLRLNGDRYQPIAPNLRGQLWSEQLELYLGIYQRQLRYFTARGQLVPTPQEAAIQSQSFAEQERERAEQERERAEQERERAEQERERAERLAEQLKALGIEPQA